MINNTLKIALRHLWRNRLFTTLNVFGLCISISACWIIYRIIGYEFSYDAQLPNKEHIYKVISSFVSEDKTSKMGGVAAPLYQGIQEEITGLEHVVPVFFQGINRAETQRNGEKFTLEDPQHVAATNNQYFQMLPYNWLAGDKVTALTDPKSVVLTERRAKEYFPNAKPEDMLHQTITYYGRDTVQRTVTGIVSDFNKPSEFIAEEMIALPGKVYESYMWTNTNGGDRLYLQFKKDANVIAKLKQINELDKRHWKAFADERGSELKKTKSYELLPIQEVHFATDVSDYGISKTSKPVMFGLVGIGVFLLILACINYINTSVAQMPQRGKEIGVRKTLGSSKWHLMNQFLVETLLTTFIASILAFAFGKIGFSILKELIPTGVTFSGEPHVFPLFVSIIIILITCLAGLYPSWLITRVKTVEVFKNSFTVIRSGSRFSLQQALIIFQFAIAMVFIICTIIVGAQLRHTLKADMGFNKEAIVLIDIPWKYLGDARYSNKQFTLFSELRKQPGIKSVALGIPPLSSGYSSSPFQTAVDGKDLNMIKMFKKNIDTAYLRLYQMQLVAGRNILPSDTISEFVINETAVKAFGFPSPKEALGKMINQLGNTKHAIVGVVKDFHTQDFYTSIEPLVMMSDKSSLSTLNIKLDTENTDQWQATLKAIEHQWRNFYPPEGFRYTFYDETIEAMYKQERQIAKLINLAMAITLFISCLGLFGLVTLTAFQRTKEIGIRKVLGATAMGIVTMLSKDFIKLVVIALIVASPVAWWAMNKWLENFVYKINIEWWMFVVAAASAITIALLTVSWQATRAALVNPVDSLRNE